MVFLRDYREEHGTDACSFGQTKGELHLHDLLKRITCGKTMFWIYDCYADHWLRIFSRKMSSQINVFSCTLHTMKMKGDSTAS